MIALKLSKNCHLRGQYRTIATAYIAAKGHGPSHYGHLRAVLLLLIAKWPFIDMVWRVILCAGNSADMSIDGIGTVAGNGSVRDGKTELVEND